jgi:proline iminopeptidase
LQIKEFEKIKSIPTQNTRNYFFNYTEHILRMPIDEWPEAINRSFNHMNPNVYVYMQGPSEFGITGDASLKDWDVTAQLKTLTVQR